MTGSTRRQTLMGLVAAGLIPVAALANTRVQITIIGGGFGGATAAQTLRALLPSAHIRLINAKSEYWACPFSNLVLTGARDMAAQHFDYKRLKARGMDIMKTRAVDINAQTKHIRLQDGTTHNYDILILAPGISFRWNALDGYDQDAAQILPHAWQAGEQTRLLQHQLAAMADGGTVIISVPQAPYRCPPGPYERASLIAHYLKTQKPRSKLIILDAKESFSKQALFEQAWAEDYSGLIDWRAGSNDGRVIRVDAENKTVFTDFEEIKADVINIIPPQKAGIIAQHAGVIDASGWCPINGLDFSSPLQPDIYIIGDSTIATPMPKSAFSAALQGKICAIQIARKLAGLAAEPTRLTNTCYSYTSPDTAISISGVYDNQGGTLTQIKGAGGLSPLDGPDNIRKAEARQAADWYRSATREAFG